MKNKYLFVRKLLKLIPFFLNQIRFLLRKIYFSHEVWISRKAVLTDNQGGSIKMGSGTEIHPYSCVMTYGGNIEIGKNCSLNPFSIIYGHGGCKIGDGVRIAAHVTIIPANHNHGDDDTIIYKSGVTAIGINIGDNVWIGSGAKILDGVTIGKNSVIAANSMVAQSVDENSIVAGVPARVIRKLTTKK